MKEREKALRQKAEALLGRGRTYLSSADFCSMAEVFQELQVHQAELEIQNEELRRAHEELAESNLRYRELFDFAPMAYFLLDRTGAIIEANLAAAEMMGIDRKALAGKPFAVFCPSRRQVELFKHRCTVFETSRPQVLEVELHRRDGSAFHAHMESTVIPGPQDGPRCLTAVVDISERRRSEELLRRSEEEMRNAKESADEANRMKSGFLAYMSHEIRTPLAGLAGMADLLLRSNLPPEPADYCRMLRSSIDALQEIVDEILDFSKIEAGRMELSATDFSLPDLVGDLGRMLGLRAEEKGIGFHIEIDPRLPPLLNGDAGRLRQILLNLAGNAIKFTEKGGVFVSLGFDGALGEHIRLEATVRDTGIGISSDLVERLFQPFSQADGSTSRRFGGTGLGLAISKRLVEAMGGTIGVRSEEGRGSVFSFSVVLRRPEARPAVSAVVAEGPATEDVRGGKILVAEDHPINQKLMSRLLEIHGFKATIAENGRQALDILSRECFDLVLMDMQMPDMDGLEATRRIRQQEQGSARRIPIIALTANALPGDRERCLEAGMDGYLSKPIRSDNLLTLMKEYLGASSP